MTTTDARLAKLERRENEHRLGLRLAVLREVGYKGRVHNPSDAQVAAEANCENCHRRKLNYFGVCTAPPKDYSYIAFMQCPTCRFWTEF